MKKIITLVIGCIILLQSISCAGLGNYSYEIVNGYQLRQVSVGDVIIEDKNDDTVIPGHVYQFCYNNQFIGAKQVEITDEDTFDTSKAKYYIINTDTNIVSEAMTQQEYEQYLIENDIKNMCDWKDTSQSEL